MVRHSEKPGDTGHERSIEKITHHNTENNASVQTDCPLILGQKGSWGGFQGRGANFPSHLVRNVPLKYFNTEHFPSVPLGLDYTGEVAVELLYKLWAMSSLWILRRAVYRASVVEESLLDQSESSARTGNSSLVKVSMISSW